MPDPGQEPAAAVLEHVNRCLARGEWVWLGTVLATWTASPRPPGALMALSESGEWLGTGLDECLEQSLIREMAAGAGDGKPRLVEYGITEEDQARWGLPAGERLRLVVERLEPERHAGPVARVLDGLAERHSVTRRISRDNGDWLFADASVPGDIEEQADEFLHTINPCSRMLMIGAGEVARCVAPMAVMNGFSVTLCDPRGRFLENFREPGVNVNGEAPDELIPGGFSDAHCAILALSGDPRLDDAGLLAALRTNAFYIGALGAQPTAALRRERLHREGVTDSRMGRLHAPIGFDIGSQAPPSIAVAIMAQVLAERYRLLRRTSRHDT